MKNSEANNSIRKESNLFQSNYAILAGVSVFSLLLTFFIAVANFAFLSKAVLLAFIILFNLLICFALFVRQKRQVEDRAKEANATGYDSPYSREIEEKLLALEEASEYFGASLKPEDMFRLVSSRINEIIPFDCIALFVATENGINLQIAAAAGENSKPLANLKFVSNKGLAGKTFISQNPQTDDNLVFDKNVLPAESLKNLKSAITVPLWHEAKVYGVLELLIGETKRFNQDALKLLEAVGERVTPLFLSSLAFKESLSNALTDVLTGLPNERAFFLVLENQIAEAQRFREERPLTILAVDVKQFKVINKKNGHSTGDRILCFAADNIKGQLRQMDFLARASNDEFLIILPTATREITQEIIGRIEKAFQQNHFALNEKEEIGLSLNFGAASFWQEGETAQKLLQNARLRKEQTKSAEKNNLIWFPQEFAN
jgi:diguanylate cyclase (GGDEF)-like protein